MTLTFKQISPQRLAIFNDETQVGQIFVKQDNAEPSNVIQICGFSEAFDLWGCGPFSGSKDIQLLFDGAKMPGEFNQGHFGGCLRCYMEPCACEINRPQEQVGVMPFTLKREADLKHRIKGIYGSVETIEGKTQ